jgi:hypothetical protein
MKILQGIYFISHFNTWIYNVTCIEIKSFENVNEQLMISKLIEIADIPISSHNW